MADSHNEIGICHPTSEDEALLDESKAIGNGELKKLATKDFPEDDSVEGKVTEHKLMKSEMSTVDSKNITTKQKQKRKACKIEPLDKSVIKEFDDDEKFAVNISRKRNINTSLATEMPANVDQSIALVKKENEILEQILQDFENLHNVDIPKRQAMLKTTLKLKAKNEKLRNEYKKLVQDVNDFKENNEKMNAIIDVLKEHGEEFDDKSKHLIVVTPEVIKLCQEIKKLKNNNALMLSENNNMRKEVEEFIKANEYLEQIIYDLKKHNENANKDLDSVKEENKTLNEKLQQFIDNNIDMNQKILNLINKNVISYDKLKVAEADNANKVQRIEMLHGEIENFKKDYLSILQTSQFSDTLQLCKKNVSVEATLENV